MRLLSVSVLRGAGVLRVSCLFCACVWLFVLWRVHVIAYMFCACLVHAWVLCMLGFCMLHACFVHAVGGFEGFYTHSTV